MDCVDRVHDRGGPIVVDVVAAVVHAEVPTSRKRCGYRGAGTSLCATVGSVIAVPKG